MPAQETGARQDCIPRESKPRTEAMPAAQPRDQGPEEQEDGDVGPETVYCPDPALGAGHLRPVPGTRERGWPGRYQAGPHQKRGPGPGLGSSGQVENGGGGPAPNCHVSQWGMG